MIIIAFLFLLIAAVYGQNSNCINVGKARSSIEEALAILNGTISLLTGEGIIDHHSQFTGFHAKLTSDITLGPSQTVIFNKVISNVGNNYNPHSGHFTAPYNGMYFFTSSFLKNSGSYELYLQMVQNSDEISKGYAARGNVGEAASMTAIVALKKDDVIKVRHYPGISSETIQGDWSYFTGFLLAK